MMPMIDEDLQRLQRFAAAAWHNPEAHLRRHPTGNFEYIELKDYYPAFRFLYCGTFRHDKVLVTNEYRFAMRALQTDRYDHGACIVGQPGIGKSLFLLYALVYLLGEGHSVVLQLLPDFYVYFTNTATLHSLTDLGPLANLSVKWILSNEDMDSLYPPRVLLGNCWKARLVRACSATMLRLKWASKRCIECYVMDIWSRQDMANLSILLDLDPERMVSLADEWGNVPRDVLFQMKDGDKFAEERYRCSALLAARRCSQALTEGRSGYLSDDIPLDFYFLRPRFFCEPTCRRFSYIYIPTWTLARFLAESLWRLRKSERQEFAWEMSRHDETRAVLNAIYESSYHSFFCEGRGLPCHWLASGRSQLPAKLNGTTTFVHSTRDVLSYRDPPYYWIPSQHHFPGIDSILVTKTALFIFQIAVVRIQKPAPLEGAGKLRRSMRADLRNLPLRVVFLGHEDSEVKAVARQYSDRLSAGARKHVPIGWSLMNPLDKSIEFRWFHNETGPVPVSAPPSDPSLIVLDEDE